ncbi:MAG: L-ribulose-5-phosphate 4-epimerase [Deinococcus-Thermus bacterium]|jgi:L-ribulose-5-phosphate 4-epimerase|nr:L-ribulose-5-phosphate 4-epimerase [Deinococcota bacterium]
MTDELRVLRQEVARLHQVLPAEGLVAWTSGNVSARTPAGDGMVIKASGVKFEDLTADTLCEVDLGSLESRDPYRPSSDTATHAYVYREMPWVGGVVHTHSPYATAWAALGKDVPCFLTAMADEFGGAIPCAGFALIGGEEIGREIVRTLDGHRSPAVLLQNHGVFAVGRDAESAVKAAVMCEDVARTSFLATQLGEPIPIDEADVDRLHRRYRTEYGQPDT